MSLSPVVEENFYIRPATDVARDLLGMRLVRMMDGIRIAGTIVETEAYVGEHDLACHARHGRTPRTAVMYGPPGRAYVYFTYGMHWLLNAVCLPEGEPAAVLIRAIQPLEGLDVIAARRNGQPPVRWTDGPGKICQALGIDGTLNGSSLTDPVLRIMDRVGRASFRCKCPYWPAGWHRHRSRAVEEHRLALPDSQGIGDHRCACSLNENLKTAS
jgi:DNA-3-methyladenine glycosylase